jgi:uncharacterized protein with HEPN domain
MPREPKAYRHDMRQAAALIAQLTDGLDFAVYAADAMVRAAVERQFEIIGEGSVSWRGSTRRRRSAASAPGRLPGGIPASVADGV